jgi:hypothetical protein
MPANRAKALARVGITFAICFCIGPPIGAYFASQPVVLGQALGMELNIYAAPAILTLVLPVAETVFLWIVLPETRGKKLGVPGSEKSGEHSADYRVDGNGGGGDRHVKKEDGASAPVRPLSSGSRCSRLCVLHFLFLGIFSGVEFSLTFLTFDRT